MKAAHAIDPAVKRLIAAAEDELRLIESAAAILPAATVAHINDVVRLGALMDEAHLRHCITLLCVASFCHGRLFGLAELTAPHGK